MQKIEDGIFAMNQLLMPYGPEEYNIPRYGLMDTFGNMEMEEAAARYVVICQEAGQWCGVSLRRIFGRMREENQAINAQCRVLDAYITEQWAKFNKANAAYQQSVKRRKRLNVLTLGIYGARKSKPEAPKLSLDDQPEIDKQLGNAMPTRPTMLMQGFADLVEMGVVNVEREKEGNYDVIFPTPMLLAHLGRFRRS